VPALPWFLGGRLKDGRPFSSRIELDRIMLAQNFGGAGELAE
jgi:hypothetical protein